MKHIVTPIMLGTSLLIAPSLALAASKLNDAQLDAVTAGANVHMFTGTTGQPNQIIGTTIPDVRPGHAANAAGSAFNPSGTAGGLYAGSQPQNSINPKSVSQYDVAGFQQFHNH
jgi:hypothetical protein